MVPSVIPEVSRCPDLINSDTSRWDRCLSFWEHFLLFLLFEISSSEIAGVMGSPHSSHSTARNDQPPPVGQPRAYSMSALKLTCSNGVSFDCSNAAGYPCSSNGSNAISFLLSTAPHHRVQISSIVTINSTVE